MKAPLNVVDMLAILPYYIGFMLEGLQVLLYSRTVYNHKQMNILEIKNPPLEDLQVYFIIALYSKFEYNANTEFTITAFNSQKEIF